MKVVLEGVKLSSWSLPIEAVDLERESERVFTFSWD